MDLARRLARVFGYELVPRRKLKEPMRQIAAMLERAAVDAVIDVGANQGQYAMALRGGGWAGPILSIEPIAELQAILLRRASRDPFWRIAAPFAAGATDGKAVLEISRESDMSSLRRQSELLRRLSPSSAVRERREIAVRRLDRLAEISTHWRRLFLKLDVQGAELEVLAGASELEPRIVGLQLEMALVPLYEGETDWRSVIDGLAAKGFGLYLLIPGYFDRKLGRLLQVDGVFLKDDGHLGAAGA
jgi:FkbM family methyltransferase